VKEQVVSIFLRKRDGGQNRAEKNGKDLKQGFQSGLNRGKRVKKGKKKNKAIRRGLRFVITKMMTRRGRTKIVKDEKRTKVSGKD